MPHIDLPIGVPGIRSAMQFRPETAVHLNALAEELLRADNTLSRGNRELIASPPPGATCAAFGSSGFARLPPAAVARQR
jgi:hypothetical protein